MNSKSDELTDGAQEDIDLAAAQARESEIDVSSDSPALPLFAKVHPAGVVGIGAAIAAAIGHLAFDTERLIGNMSLWQWVLLAVIIVLAFIPPALNAVRAAIEFIGESAMRVVWILGWAVFIVQFINVLTRYLNPFFETDILLGQLTSAAWQLFAIIALIGLPYGVKYGVNPRIDFWWANWSDRTKAWLDFVMHTFLFLPFLFTMCMILRNEAAFSLGKKRGNGAWPDGWRVWESWEVATDADQLPIGPIKALIFVGFLFFALQVFAEIVKAGFVLMGNREYGQVTGGDEFQRIE